MELNPIMYKLVEVTAEHGGEAHLIITPEKTALVDSGFAFCAHRMSDNIKAALGERELDYILLTHSHYDHAAGAAICRENFPKAKIAASEYAAKIFSKPSARAVMREMDNNAANLAGYPAEYDDMLDKLSVDVILREGDTVDLGSVKFRVMETPGHTRCSIAFFDENERLMISSETFGVPIAEGIVEPCYIVGYQMSIDAIRRGAECDPKVIIHAHLGVMEGEKECRDFFEKAMYWAVRTKNEIVAGHRDGKTDEELMMLLKHYFYIGEIMGRHPLKAFLLNAKYTVPMLIRECGDEE